MGEAVFLATYYQDELVMVFTASTENSIDQTIAQTVVDINTLVEMSIVPSDFQQMHNRVLEEHSSLTERAGFPRCIKMARAYSEYRQNLKNASSETESH